MIRYHISNIIRVLKNSCSLFYAKKKHFYEFTLNGGFGDVVLDSQFLYKIKGRDKNAYIKVYFRNNFSAPNKDNFSWGKTRLYETDHGNLANPIYEWLSYLKELHIIDEMVGCDIDRKDRGIRLYPESFNVIFGGYISPVMFNDLILTKIFELHDAENRELFNRYRKIINEHRSDNKLVSLHLRRNGEKIIKLAKKIQMENPNTTFILLGSSEHQNIPNIGKLKNVVSLIDSYKLGLDTIDVLKLSSLSDLFVGGRGGFELVHWLRVIPTICFFDEMGFLEIKQKWWDRKLWENNRIKKLYHAHTDVEEVMVDIINKKILK